jgi:hypothetical protein
MNAAAKGAVKGFLVGIALAVPVGFAALFLYIGAFGLFFFGDIPIARTIQKLAGYVPYAGAGAAIVISTLLGYRRGRRRDVRRG